MGEGNPTGKRFWTQLEAGIDRERLAGSRLEPYLPAALAYHQKAFATGPAGNRSWFRSGGVVVEFTKGQTVLHDAPLEVITNAPNDDWHLTNLRNDITLSPVGLPGKRIEELDFRPLGGGTGMIGLQGDYTPPSRFVRAVPFAKSARPTQTGAKTRYETFRILDSFNVPLGAAEGEASKTKTDGIRSWTIWTTAYDTKTLVMQYHTMHNRRVRQVDLNKIDFAGAKALIRLPLDRNQSQDIEEVTPRR